MRIDFRSLPKWDKTCKEQGGVFLTPFLTTALLRNWDGQEEYTYNTSKHMHSAAEGSRREL